jgi:hypothetical protein
MVQILEGAVSPIHRSDSVEAAAQTASAWSKGPMCKSGNPTNSAADPQPSVFLSYSWEDPEHAAWVSTLAKRLSDDGVSVLSDTAVRLGDEFAPFMDNICDADRVLVVCTPSYKIRADERLGGVGYETRLLVARLIKDQKNTTVIPLLRRGSWEESAPRWVGGCRYLDFRRETPSESAYASLLASLRLKSPEIVPDIKVPVPRSLRPAPVQRALFTIFLVFTILTVLVAMADGQIALPIASSADHLKLVEYIVLTVVRLGAACLLLVGAAWLIRLEYRNGAASESMSRRAQTVLGFSVLAGASCFSSMLNLSLSGFDIVPDGAAFTWPERLSYGYLVGGFITLAFSLWKTSADDRRLF